MSNRAEKAGATLRAGEVEKDKFCGRNRRFVNLPHLGLGVLIDASVEQNEHLAGLAVGRGRVQGAPAGVRASLLVGALLQKDLHVVRCAIGSGVVQRGRELLRRGIRIRATVRARTHVPVWQKAQPSLHVWSREQS